MSSVVTLPLADVCDFRRGLTYKKSDEVEFSRNVVLRANNINLSDHTLNFDDLRCIQTAIPDEKKVKGGSLLICTASGSKSHLGKVAYIDSDLDYGFGGFMAMITPRCDLDPKYMFFLMTSPDFKGHLGKVTDGANINNLKFSDIKDFPVPVPPLPEQQRIVCILDQAFEGIAKAKANAERNLANAKELFESERESLFLEDAETEERCFDEICDITSTLVDPREAAYQPMLHIGAGNIESDSGALSNVQSAAEEKLISGKFIFDESMVLYSKIRPYLKKVVAPEFRGLCSADIYPLTPNKNLIQRGYLYHMLLTKQFTDFAILGSERAGMPKVNRNHLFAYKVGVPAMSRQTEVVGRLQDARAASENLCANYKARIRAIDELKSSILQQAFSGNL